MKARVRALQTELGLRSRAHADDETDCDCPCENCEAGDCQACNCAEHRSRRLRSRAGRTIFPAGSDLGEYIANRDLESQIWDARRLMRLMQANAH